MLLYAHACRHTDIHVHKFKNICFKKRGLQAAHGGAHLSFNSRIQEADTEGFLGIQGQPGLQRVAGFQVNQIYIERPCYNSNINKNKNKKTTTSSISINVKKSKEPNGVFKRHYIQRQKNKDDSRLLRSKTIKMTYLRH